MSNTTTRELTATQSRNEVLATMSNEIAPVVTSAIQYGDNAYAFPVELSDGSTRYYKMELTVALNKATTTAKAFDPAEKRAEWLADKEAKEAKAKEAAAKKAEKIARDTERRAAKKAKAEAEAK